MAEGSSIGWTHHSLCWWWGCTEIEGSPACFAPCYAKEFSERLKRARWGDDQPREFHFDNAVRLCKRFNRIGERLGVRQRVFVQSMSDFFEDRRDLDDIRDKAVEVMLANPWNDYLILTKRHEFMLDYMTNLVSRVGHVIPHFWCGVTAENQKWWDARVPALLKTPAARRFVSYEPACGPVDATAYLPGLSWVIVGGASGKNHEKLAMHPDWLKSIADQTLAAGAALFVKQDSARQPGKQGRIPPELWRMKMWPRSASDLGIDDMAGIVVETPSLVGDNGQLRMV